MINTFINIFAFAFIFFNMIFRFTYNPELVNTFVFDVCIINLIIFNNFIWIQDYNLIRKHIKISKLFYFWRILYPCFFLIPIGYYFSAKYIFNFNLSYFIFLIPVLIFCLDIVCFYKTNKEIEDVFGKD